MEVSVPEQATDDGTEEPAVSADTDKQEEASAPAVDDEPQWVCCMRQVITILGGEVTIAIYQEFIIRNNHTDLQILKNTKVSDQQMEPIIVQTMLMYHILKLFCVVADVIES